MHKLQTFFRMIQNDKLGIACALIRNIIKSPLHRLLADSLFIKLVYFASFRKFPNLKHQTFYEKLQWLKLHDRNPLYTILVDKYAVKKWVADRIGEQYIIPTLGVWNDFAEIDFDSLPNQFVLKCTHDSGGLVICKDKKLFNVSDAQKKISNSLKTNYYFEYREWPYKNVPPRIIAEKYMEDEKTKDLRDYKFFCFNGIVRCYKIDFDRFTSHKANYYDENSVLINVGEKKCPPDANANIDQPVNIHKMISLAQELSNSIPFVRVDFYEVNGKIFFGEMTLYPAAGFGEFCDDYSDKMLGEWLKLSQVKR